MSYLTELRDMGVEETRIAKARETQSLHELYDNIIAECRALDIPEFRDEDKTERGATAVEFAFVVVPLLMIVFAIISFGIIFAQQLSLGNSARQAARFAVVADRSCADIKAEAQDAADTIGMDGVDTTVTIKVGTTEATAVNPCGIATSKPCDNSKEGDSVYVRIDYTSSLVIPLVVVNDNFALHGEGVFRCEWS